MVRVRENAESIAMFRSPPNLSPKVNSTHVIDFPESIAMFQYQPFIKSQLDSTKLTLGENPESIDHVPVREPSVKSQPDSTQLT